MTADGDVAWSETVQDGMKQHETSGKFCLLTACFVKNLLRVLHFVSYKKLYPLEK